MYYYDKIEESFLHQHNIIPKECHVIGFRNLDFIPVILFKGEKDLFPKAYIYPLFPEEIKQNLIKQYHSEEELDTWLKTNGKKVLRGDRKIIYSKMRNPFNILQRIVLNKTLKHITYKLEEKINGEKKII